MPLSCRQMNNWAFRPSCGFSWFLSPSVYLLLYLLVEPFSWEDYLRETSSIAASPTCFKQVAFWSVFLRLFNPFPLFVSLVLICAKQFWFLLSFVFPSAVQTPSFKWIQGRYETWSAGPPQLQLRLHRNGDGHDGYSPAPAPGRQRQHQRLLETDRLVRDPAHRDLREEWRHAAAAAGSVLQTVSVLIKDFASRMTGDLISFFSRSELQLIRSLLLSDLKSLIDLCSGFRMNASSWPMFLLRTLSGAEMAPASAFKKVIAPTTPKPLDVPKAQHWQLAFIVPALFKYKDLEATLHVKNYTFLYV